MNREEDFLRALNRQLLARLLSADVTIKKSTSETFSQLLASYIQEVAALCKNSASAAGRTAVNVVDVLANCGDFVDIAEIFEQSLPNRVFFSAINGVSSRRKPRLRPTLTDAAEAYKAYTPGFLPVLPKQAAASDGSVLSVQSYAREPERFLDDLYENTMKEIERDDSRAMTTSKSVTGGGHTRTLWLCDQQPLRSSHREQGIVVKASAFVSGSVPVLDNS